MGFRVLASEMFGGTRHGTSEKLSRNASHSLPRFQVGPTVPRRCRASCRGHGIAHCPSRFGESFQDGEAHRSKTLPFMSFSLAASNSRPEPAVAVRARSRPHFRGRFLRDPARAAEKFKKRRAALEFETVIDDLLAQLPTARATWVLILTGLTGIAFSLSAFACDRLGHTIISPFLAAGA